MKYNINRRTTENSLAPSLYRCYTNYSIIIQQHFFVKHSLTYYRSCQSVISAKTGEMTKCWTLVPVLAACSVQGASSSHSISVTANVLNSAVAVEYSTVQYRAVQCRSSTVQYRADHDQCIAVLHTTVQYRARQCNVCVECQPLFHTYWQVMH